MADNTTDQEQAPNEEEELTEQDISVQEVVSGETISVAVGGEEGVEVETILQGQSGPGDLDYIVQEVVETTTDGVLSSVDMDPVDNVIIALQNTDHDPSGTIVGEYTTVQDDDGGSDQEMTPSSSRKRKSSSRTNPRKKSRKGRKGTTSASTRFISRHAPIALATAQSVKDAKESNEASFDPLKRPRRWSRTKVPVQTLDGGQFSVDIWTTGVCVCVWVDHMMCHVTLKGEGRKGTLIHPYMYPLHIYTVEPSFNLFIYCINTCNNASKCTCILK